MIGTYFLIITCQSKDEVRGFRTRSNRAEDGTLTTFPTNRDEAPRFPVPVQVERMEMGASK